MSRFARPLIFKALRIVPAFIALCLIVGTSASAQERFLGADLQYALLTKILAQERDLDERVGDELVVGVLFQSRYPTSRNMRDAFLEAARRSEQKTVSGIPVRVVSLKMTNGKSLTEPLEQHGIDALYVAPLRGVERMSRITDATRERGVLTFTAVAQYVTFGLAVGLEVRGNKPRILINLDSARAEGVQFDSRLLRLSTVIRDAPG